MYDRPVDVATDLDPTEFLRLVADPLRWQLMRELAGTDHRVSELTALAGKPQNLVSYHLRQLRDAGLVSAHRSSADGRDTYYRADLDRCARLLRATGSAIHPGLQLDVAPPPAQAGPTRRPRVLFICTGNSARSQIAEGLLDKMSGHAVDARSAGTHPTRVHPNAVRVMAARDVDISRHRTKHLRRFARMQFDQVVTLCDRAREVCPEFTGSPPVSHWSTANPAAEDGSDDETYAAFESTAQDLEARITYLLPLLTKPSTERSLR
jgi:protein-tyrosine-phosphatase/DNA-binding transcriptional ArsR family regulator